MSAGHSETVVVAGEQAGERLDRVLAIRVAELSRSRHKALIESGHVAIAGLTIRDPSHRVNAGDSIVVEVPPPEDTAACAEDIPLTVVYEDAALIVIDKPAGLVVHPAAGNWTGTLVNALIAHCGDSLSGVGGTRRPGIVHRLDKGTSGLMVAAKTDSAHRALSQQFADHGRTGALRRGYLALVWGSPARPHGTVSAPLGRHPHVRDRMTVRADGRPATTHWEVMERFYNSDRRPLASLLACRLETGRTHQIRVHLATTGHPILGDETYGSGFRTKANQLSPPTQAALRSLGRQALHAYLLGFAHPDTAQLLEFRSELPASMARLQDHLRLETAAQGTRDDNEIP